MLTILFEEGNLKSASFSIDMEGELRSDESSGVKLKSKFFPFSMSRLSKVRTCLLYMDAWLSGVKSERFLQV